MKGKIYSLALVVLSLCLVACDKDTPVPITEGSPIFLSADVVSMDSTRAMEADVYTGTSVAGMQADVWFSRQIGVYPDNATPTAPTFLPYRAKVTYDEANPTTVYVDPVNKSNPLSYPISVGENVYCVGFYPYGSWQSADGKSATHIIDGVTDVMFADQIVGSWETPFGSQRYKHLLTWLKIEAEVADVVAIGQWGAVTKIGVETPMGVTVTFPTSVGVASTISYSAEKSEINALGSVPEVPLKVTAQEVGSLLCAPQASITLKVATTEMAERSIVVPLYDRDNNLITSPQQTVGKLIIINLYFTAFNNIEATCSLVPWNERNADIVGE